MTTDDDWGFGNTPEEDDALFDALVQGVNDYKNQCDGCVVEAPLKGNIHHYDASSHNIIGCTKHLYSEDNKTFSDIKRNT